MNLRRLQTMLLGISQALLTLYNRTLKFVISGQDKPTQNGSTVTTTTSNSSHRPRPCPLSTNSTEHSSRLSTPGRFSDYPVNYSHGNVFRLLLRLADFILILQDCQYNQWWSRREKVSKVCAFEDPYLEC